MDNDDTDNSGPLSPEETAWREAAEEREQLRHDSNKMFNDWYSSRLPTAPTTPEPIPPVETALPLNERARLGLLAIETELPLWEIIDLEFPTKSSQQRGEYAAWQEAIESALRRGLLVSRLETFTVLGEPGYLPGVDWLTRESYRQWRASKINPPTNSDIFLWLGATPALSESIPPENPIAALLALLDEIDKRAAEKGAGFNRNSLPGTKQEFHCLAIAFNRRAFSRALSTFSDYMKGHCQFQRGDKPEHGKGAAVWALFPEYSLKLG